ncbi:hypothetical protein B0E46_10765 [Rhodanobacter sp. B04]|nr:hypothetical protein B0E46_10765 [Rhodanobacter sp. B04]
MDKALKVLVMLRLCSGVAGFMMFRAVAAILIAVKSSSDSVPRLGRGNGADQLISIKMMLGRLA